MPKLSQIWESTFKYSVPEKVLLSSKKSFFVIPLPLLSQRHYYEKKNHFSYISFQCLYCVFWRNFTLCFGFYCFLWRSTGRLGHYVNYACTVTKKWFFIPLLHSLRQDFAKKYIIFHYYFHLGKRNLLLDLLTFTSGSSVGCSHTIFIW